MRNARRLLAVGVVVVCAALLSACSVSPFPDNDDRQADARMAEIAAAVNAGDAAALKGMFSGPALDQATGFDEGLDYFLSFFPDGGLTWERDVVGAEAATEFGKKTEVLRAFYDVTAGGKDYTLFFADFTRNEIIDPDNVGIFAMGVTPATDDIHSGAAEPFFLWANAIRLRGLDRFGYPGVYVPDPDLVSPSQQADARMGEIAAAVESHDAAALTGMFSPRAVDEATELDQAAGDFLGTFPAGGLSWERQVANPGDVLTAFYRVSVDGTDFWLFFAEPAVDTGDTADAGLSTLAVSPWTEPDEPIVDTAFDDWTTLWISSGGDGGGVYGIYVPD